MYLLVELMYMYTFYDDMFGPGFAEFVLF